MSSWKDFLIGLVIGLILGFGILIAIVWVFG